ncbi:hypothetical protein ACFL1R_12950 [Candidatus Latescibacterota bacterium]
MKRIVIFMTPILMLAFAYGCSKDHEDVTFETFKITSSPGNLLATYDPAQDIVNLTWTMSETSGVGDFLIARSDSSDFDLGEIWTQFANMKSISPPFMFTYNASRYIPADVDSLILYFTVSAVYDNETFSSFVGPRAEVDSALVFRK